MRSTAIKIVKGLRQPVNQNMQGPGGINSELYHYWRVRILYATILGYAAFYLLRLNFSMAMPAMMDVFSLSKVELGLIASIWSVVYGVGKFVNGYISDRSDARKFMTIGLIGTAIANIFMGFSDGLLYFGICWAVSGWFQSMAWPPVVRMLSHWFSPKELGTKWGIWSSAHQIGGASAFLLSSYLIVSMGWAAAFYVPAILCFAFAWFIYDRVRDTPESMGFPEPEVYKGHVPPKSVDAQENEPVSYNDLIKQLFMNPLLWCVCLGNMCLYIVRIGVFTWAPTFLIEMKGSSLVTSGWQSVGFEIAGLLGGFSAGWISDRFFAGRRGPVSVIYMASLVFALLYFWKAPSGHSFLDAMAMFPVGFMVYGPQVLAGVAAADFGSKRAVGIATGLNGTFGYIGGAISGVGTGYIAENYGWDGGFMFFILCTIIGVAFFAMTWQSKSKILVK